MTGNRAIGQSGKEAPKRDFVIEEVQDLDSARQELVSLFLDFEAYYVPFHTRKLRDDWEQRWLEWHGSHQDRLILLARREGKPVAYLMANLVHDYGLYDERYVYVSDAFVREGARHGGIGTELLARTEAWAAGHAAEEVRLDVVAGNELGQRFWQWSGFEPMGTALHKRLGVAP